MERAYATALDNTLSQTGADEATVVKGLVTHLEKSGRTKLLPRILAELKKSLLRKEASAPRIEVAREEEGTRALKEAKTLGVSANVTVNPSLLSGFRIRHGSKLTDRSGKRALIDLYRNITNA